MRKTTLFSLLTMFFLFVGSNAWANETWVKTAPTDLQTGDVVAIVDLTRGLVMPNNNGASAAPTAAAITFNSEKTELADVVGETWQWVVTVNEAPYQFGVEGTENYLYCTNANNGVRVGTNTNNEFIMKDDFLFNTATSRYIGPYNTQDWRCYTSINSNIAGTEIAFFKKVDNGGGVTVTKPVITPAGGIFSEPQEVTITADEGCTIIYTTDGVDPGMTAGNYYTAPFTVSEDCTVKAIAYDAAGNSSYIASAQFTFATAVPTIGRLCALATSTDTPVLVEFNKWIVTGVNGSQAYFTDGTNGVLLYQSGHNFELGDMLTGTATITLTTYNECAEIKGLTSATAGVTVTKGVVATPQTVVISDIQKDMQGCLITLEGVTYNATDKVFVDDNDNRIVPYNTFKLDDYPTLEDGRAYDATGVAVWYKPRDAAGYWELAPRTADEFQLSSDVVYVAKPVIEPAGGTYAEAQTVTITADEGCTIFYTTDGTDPTAESTEYTQPFTVSQDCIVKAIAYNEDDNPSAITSAEFKFISATAIPSIARLCAVAPAEGETEVLVEFNNWIVTGVKGGQVFFTDGKNGIVNYKSQHGFEVGDVLSGSAVVTLTTFNECAEITSLTATTAGVTVTKGEGATPMSVVVGDLEKDMQGCLIYLEGVTYSEGVFVDDDDNKITPNNKFVTLPTLTEGETYNVTGVAVWFVPTGASGYWAIAPRTVDEFQQVGGTTVVATPVFDPVGGTYTGPQTITITAGEGCAIFYTTDGTDPTTESTQYTEPFTISEDCIVKAIAYDVTGNSSDIVTAEYKIEGSVIPGSGTYTHTFVTTDIPEGTTDTNFTLSDVNWVLTLNGGKVSTFSNDLGAHFGTNNETCSSVTLSTNGIPGIISSVTVEASRGKNLVGTLAVTVGGKNYNLSDGETTTALAPENTAYEFTGEEEGEVAIVWTMNSGKGAFYIKKIVIEYSNGGIVVAKPIIYPAGGTFTEPQEVTITAGDNCFIFYSLDGTEPTTESNVYAGPFIVSESCTVKAIAYDVTGAPSSIATAEFKFPQTYTTIADLCAAAPAEGEEEVLVTFNDWIVTGVKSNNVYFTDGRNGVLLYQSGHGFELGDKLTGSAAIKLLTYHDCAEIKGFTKDTEGVIVEKGATARPMSVAIADLEKNMQGCVLYYEGLTYNDGVFVDDDDNEITPYGTFITLPTLLQGKIYNVTGVAIWFSEKGVWEIAPRTADEFVLVTSQIAPTSAWSVESEVVDVTGEPTAFFTTNSDGDVTYESSDENVAVIDESGRITPIGRGVTTITAYVAETETYLPDSKSFTLTVTKDGYADVTFVYNDPDIAGQGAPDVGAELTATRNNVITLYANKAYAKDGDTHIKVYGSKYEGEGEEKTLVDPSYIRLSVVNGYSITKIVLTATGESNIKEWTDQYGKAAVVEGATATWEGDTDEVILTNLATAQARIKTIAVTYIDTDIVDAIDSPIKGAEEGAIYNLAGQRMSKMQKGINIVGGKKIAIK